MRSEIPILPTTTPLTIAASATLDLGGGSQQVASLSDYSAGLGGSIINSNTGAESILTLSPTGRSTTFSGMIAGGGTNGTISLIKAGAGTQVLAGSNTYTGDTIITGGTLNLAHPLAVQNSTVDVGSSGALSFAVGNTNPILGGLAGAGNVALLTAAAEPVTLNVGQNGQNTTYSGILSGAGGLTKQGAGILTLTASQSYNGATVINGGVLKLQRVTGGSIGIHFVGNGSPVTGSAGVVAMSNWNNLAGPFFANTALTDNSGATTTANLAVGAAGTRASGSSNQLLNGYIYDDGYNQLSATISGIPYANYSLYAYMADSNTTGIGEKLTMGGTTYYYDMSNSASYKQVTNTTLGKYPKGNYVVATGMTGDTQTVVVQGATQQISSLTGFEIVSTTVNGVNFLPIASSLTISSSATLDLGDVSQQVAALSDYSPGNGGSVINSNAGVASVLTLSPTSGSTTFSGMIQGGGTLGTISLVMSGSGTQVLSGSNTYTGATTINQSELVVNGSLVSPVTVNSGGTLGGTGYLSSGAVNAGGQLAPGNSPGLSIRGNLVLASGAEMDYELDTPSTSDIINAGNLALNLQQFSDFKFTYGSDFGPGTYTLIDAGSISGELGSNLSGTIDGLPASLSIQGNDLLVLSVVPEPSTFVLFGVGALGLLGYAWRRR